MLRGLAAFALLYAALAGAAAAHPPGTAIGRAVAGLQQAAVTYDSGSAIGELEADGLLVAVGDDSRVRVAVMPADALTEQPGGATAIAAEVAREASVGGTVVVLAGRQLGVSSEDVGADRAAALVREAERAYPTGPLSLRAGHLVSLLREEPVDAGPPWGVIAAVGSAIVLALLAALHHRTRRAAGRTSSPTP